MMIRINLLPHRQIKRAERKRQLGLMAIATVVLGAALVFMGHGVISGQLAAQQSRNQRLIDATAKLDKEIEEIKDLKADIKNMLDRKQVVENLQSNRSQAVVLLDEIARQLPESVYLKSVKQAGNVITLQGYADSNNRVAILVRSLTASKWLESPALIETHSESVNNQKLSNFTLTVKQKAITSETVGGTDPKGGKK